MKTHVFLVNDDIEEMRFFVSALNEMGDSYKCTYASSSTHALKMLQYLRPEKIFIKYNMPEMNGLEITEAIRENKELRHTPVFLFYSQSDTCTPEEVLTLGDIHCIKKPESKMDMLAVLKSIFDLPVNILSVTAP